MPKLGEIEKGTDIGYEYPGKYIWQACESCGEERWVRAKGGKAGSRICRECNPGRFQKTVAFGDKWENNKGYIWIYIGYDDFFSPMAPRRGFVLEHRLVMAKKLGRCLHPWEIVHHNNNNNNNNNKGVRYKGIKNKSDNLEDNLQLVMEAGHNQISQMESVLKRQEKRIKELEDRIIILEAESILKEVRR